ncbi:MAG: hypothetical protein PF450_10435, partial [Bacteroidales bacterium]|nr:hypothetical protein [Bacteroidales bacterium]
DNIFILLSPDILNFNSGVASAFLCCWEKETNLTHRVLFVTLFIRRTLFQDVTNGCVPMSSEKRYPIKHKGGDVHEVF